MVLNIIRGCP